MSENNNGMGKSKKGFKAFFKEHKIFTGIAVLYLIIFILLIIFRIYGAINSSNSNNDIIELTDSFITRWIVSKQLWSCFWIFSAGLIFIGGFWFLYSLVKKEPLRPKNGKMPTEEDKKSVMAIIRILFIIVTAFFAIILMFVAKSSIKLPLIFGENDWNIKQEVIIEKSTEATTNSYSYTHVTYYIEVKGFDEKIEVTEKDYNEHFEKGKNVYVIYDNEGKAREVFSPESYKYVGDKKIEK